MKQYRIAVAGTGYVGFSLTMLLAQHNHVTAVDIIPGKVDLTNSRIYQRWDKCHCSSAAQRILLSLT